MMYSVWNPSTRRYDYYESSRGTPEHAPAPRHLRAQGMGATPDESGWPVPRDARRVGSGEEARGRIASLGTSDTPNSMGVVAIATGLYVLWRTLQ